MQRDAIELHYGRCIWVIQPPLYQFDLLMMYSILTQASFPIQDLKNSRAIEKKNLEWADLSYDQKLAS